MIVTRQWIHDHSTPAGGWNRKQIEALGLKWPAPKGWIKRLEGTEINGIAKAAFEIQSETGIKRIEDIMVAASLKKINKYEEPIFGGVLSSHPVADAGIMAANKRISELEEMIGYMDERIIYLERAVERHLPTD